MPDPNCEECEGLGGYPRCGTCHNINPEKQTMLRKKIIKVLVLTWPYLLFGGVATHCYLSGGDTGLLMLVIYVLLMLQVMKDILIARYRIMVTHLIKEAQGYADQLNVKPHRRSYGRLPSGRSGSMKDSLIEKGDAL